MDSSVFSIRNSPVSVPPTEITMVFLSKENFFLSSSLEKFVCLTIGPTLLMFPSSGPFSGIITVSHFS